MQILGRRKTRYSGGSKQPNGQIYCCYFSRITKTCYGSVTHLIIWKFYFLENTKENSYKVRIHGEAVNQKDELGMKVLSRLLFTSREKFIDSFRKMLPRFLYYRNVLIYKTKEIKMLFHQFV